MAVTPLGALIEECQQLFLDQHGVPLSYGAISRRGGGVLTRQRVQQLATGPIRRLPERESVAALATGLGLPESVVFERWSAAAGHGQAYELAARRGVPRQVQLDAGEADPNVDPPGPDSGA